MSDILKIDRTIKLFASHLLGQFIVIASVIIAPSMLLKYWSSETYGLWVLASGVAIFFSYSDLGVSVALNSAMYTVGRRSRGAAIVVFYSALNSIRKRLCWVATISAFALCFVLIFNMYSADFLVALFFCSLTFAFQPVVNIMLATYRWRDEPWRGVFYDQLFRIIELFFVIAVFGRVGLVWAAVMSFALKFVYVLIIIRGVFGLYVLGNRYANKLLSSAGLSLNKNGVGGFFSFVGSTLSVQGFMLLAGVIGATSAATFSSLRTISRIHIQPASVLLSTASPIFNVAFAKDEFAKLRRYSALLGVLIALIWIFVFLISVYFASDIQKYWLHDKFLIDVDLLKLMFFAAGVSSANQFCITIMQSANLYLAGGVLQLMLFSAGLALGGVLILNYGLHGLAFAWLCSEILFFLYMLARVWIVLKI